MNTTILIIISIVVILFILLEVDHFLTVRRMNRQLRRSQDRFDGMRIDLEEMRNRKE